VDLCGLPHSPSTQRLWSWGVVNGITTRPGRGSIGPRSIRGPLRKIPIESEMHDTIAISIAPCWVEMILDKRKTFELRRRGPSPSYVGARMLIYATRPWSSLVAMCVIKEIRIANPDALWGEVGERTGCTLTQFRTYFTGTLQGVAIEMSDVRQIEVVSLENLMNEFNWRPPVSWCRVPNTSKLVSVLETAP
jgi:predicted transcriptional regulator